MGTVKSVVVGGSVNWRALFGSSFLVSACVRRFVVLWRCRRRGRRWRLLRRWGFSSSEDDGCCHDDYYGGYGCDDVDKIVLYDVEGIC